ncbi:uncharacterized protein LOC115953166 [Quercus lobata]|uniref:uncharacterized protein LOC115953166 n=1 Tax=Quercus lobata TaxID=97700 RepID=UPI001248097E|nr:uncharacterized protein LOC115953166 [Quercus lobata]
MDQAVVDGLLNLRLTREEEEEITITTRCRSDLLEECNLSLFGRLLSDRHQNQRALKSTLRSAWKMGSDLQIVDVGNNVLQFKFSSEYQLQWVEKNGPWNFDNNLLLLCRWRRGLSSTNITFTHSPFWVQIWGLPFELMAEEVCRDLGNSLGRFIETDRRSGQTDQAKFMRVRVDLQLDKPLRRGGRIASVEGEKFWVSFRYERLPTFCFHCGRLGHDLKHCQEISNNQSSSNQYGDWLRAQGSSKTGGDRSRSTSSGGKDDSNEDKVEEHIPSTAKNSYTSAMDGGGSTSGIGGRIEKNQNTGKENDIIGDRENQPEKAQNGWDNSARLEQVPMHVSGARDAAGTPHLSLPRSFKIEKEAVDAMSLVGQPAQTEKDPMEVNSPLKQTEEAQLR